MGLSHFKIFQEEHEIFRVGLKKFIEKEILPYLSEWQEKGIAPKSIWRKMGEQGYLCPWIDEQYGGAGAGFEYSIIINEELERYGVDINFNLHSDIVAPYIAHFGTDEQKERWLPKCVTGEIVLAIGMSEPEAGSDVARIKTRAVREGDHYVINGQKTFITNGMNCDMILLAVKTNPDAVPPHRGISLIMVEADRPGFIKSRLLKKMGRPGSDTAELFFENCRVPAANLIGEENKGFYLLMHNLQQERIMQIVRAITSAETMLEMTLEYTKTRQIFGQPVSHFQHNTFKLVEMATEIEIGKAFFEKVLTDHMNGKTSVKEVSMAKWWITEMANRVAYHCLQLHGGYGYMDEYPISKRFRNVRLDTISAGSTEVMKNIIAKEMKII